MGIQTFNRYHPYIDEYMELIDSGRVPACKEQHQLMDFVRWKLSEPGITIDADAIEKSVEIPERYFPFKLQPWERFINSFIYGIRYADGRLVFDQFLIMLGRGAGKNGFISFNAFYMMSKNIGIPQYDIDLVATSEDQATRSFYDVYNVIDDYEGGKTKNERVFNLTREKIEHKRTRSTLVYNTSNARTKDSKRTGAVIFDEVHEYESYDNIEVFVTGLGKKPDPREFYIY